MLERLGNQLKGCDQLNQHTLLIVLKEAYRRQKFNGTILFSGTVEFFVYDRLLLANANSIGPRPFEAMTFYHMTKIKDICFIKAKAQIFSIRLS